MPREFEYFRWDSVGSFQVDNRHIPGSSSAVSAAVQAAADAGGAMQGELLKALR